MTGPSIRAAIVAAAASVLAGGVAVGADDGYDIHA
jgi:hypothetical protein